MSSPVPGERGQTRRPWAGCWCVWRPRRVTVRKAARDTHTHTSAVRFRYTVRGVHSVAGRDAEAQIHLSSYGFLSVTLDLVIEVHKGVHEYYSVAQCHQLPCTATLSLQSPALPRLRFHGRVRSSFARAALRAHLCCPLPARSSPADLLAADPSENNNPLLQLLITFMPICFR